MNIQFNIDYQTYYGQELVLSIITGRHNGVNETSQYRMHTLDGYHWSVEVRKDVKPGTQMDYFYSVLCGDNEDRKEWSVMCHRLNFDAERGLNYCVYDHWNDIPEDSYLYSSAIADCVVGKKQEKVKLNNFNKSVTLKVRAPQLRAEDQLYLIGAEPALGAWNEKKALKMTQHNINEWIVTIDGAKLVSSRLEVKFFIKNKADNDAIVWEYSDNRIVELPAMDEGDVMVYELDEAFFPLPAVRIAGTLVPVFSLRSESSFGIGDFGDLKKMVDWVSLTQQRALQILPINDTTITHTWTDSYPYSCISIFALHPQYVDLNALPALKDKEQRDKFEALRKELNALPQIDYERVNDAKTEYLRLLFEQEGQKVLTSDAFKAFFIDTESWLVPYAQYCYMRDKNGTADFSRWSDHNQWDEAERKQLSSPKEKAYKEVAFFYYVQYILSSQLKAVHEYAQAHKVILKGDIPIGVNRYGCDVWTQPRYFNLNGHDSGDVRGHSLTIHADSYLPLREDSVSAGTIDAVAGTPFDFRTPKTIGKDLSVDNKQLNIAHGYDHCFAINNYENGQLRPALLATSESGRSLEIQITAPGAHLYTGNWLDEARAKDGAIYKPQAGFAFESEFYPDCTHHAEWPQPTCTPEQPYSSQIVYRFF